MKPEKHTSSNPPEGRQIADNHWIILLVEFVHLLGLFLIHARHAKSTRATTALFDQLVRHINILAKLPDNDGAMIIRKVRERDVITLPPPNYLVLFGNLVLRGDVGPMPAGNTSHRMSPFDSALQQAFGCLAEQGIHALFLQLPGNDNAQIDRFRLALNILARFRLSDEKTGSVTFRYFGRTVAVPLIRNRHGQADPNLTLMAGLNSLSPANTLELIKQAEAYGKLAAEGNHGTSVNWFNRIFSESRLSRQLIRPPIEVNNLTWSDIIAHPLPALTTADALASKTQNDSRSEAPAVSGSDVDPSQHGPEAQGESSSKTGLVHMDRKRLIEGLHPCSPEVQDAVMIIFDADYSLITERRFGEHLDAISLILDLLEKRNDASGLIESFLFFLNTRLEWIPDSVFLMTHAQRKGVTIGKGKSAVLVGLINHRLFDLVGLVKERMLTRLKIEAVQELTFGFKPEEARKLAQRFDISLTDAKQIITLLQTCFDAQGQFSRAAFETRIDEMAPYNTPIFEMLWCLFKRTAGRSERLDFLNAIQLLMDQLDSGKGALQFLLSDIFQNPFEVKHMDRNAMVLANILLRTHNQDLNVDTFETPGEVLAVQHGLDREIQQYVNWRLEFDQARIMTKLRTIGDLLHHPMEGMDAVRNELFDHTFIYALEREIVIFFALVGGKTARLILRQALSRYMLHLEDYPSNHGHGLLKPSAVMAQLNLIVKGLGRIGREEDLEILAQLRQKVTRLQASRERGLADDRVIDILKEITQAEKAIQHG